MTTDEKLDLIIEKIQSIETNLQSIETRMYVTETKIQSMETEMQSMRSSVKKLEYSQLSTQASIDNTINKCIQALSDAHSLNASRFDKLDFESIRHNSEIAVTLAKMASDKVDELAKKVDNIA